MMIENRIQNSIAFTDKGPRKGWRTPLNIINDSEQRDEEKEWSRGPFASERGDEPRSGIPNGSTYLYTYFSARYMDHELMTMWLSVDPMADKYPSISPYNYCMWNPIKLVDPDGKDTIKIHIDKGAIEKIASDGNHRINYYRNGELIDSYSIEKDKCTFRTRSIDYENTDQKIDCRTYHLYCSNDKIGEQIFNKIASLGSPVEWVYYSIRVNEETINGDLSSSGIEDKMVHSPGIYTANNVLFWDHYHPNNSSDSFCPSHKDQDHVKLLKGARCTIFHGGKSMDFQNYVPTGDNKYISFKAFSEIWYKFAR